MATEALVRVQGSALGAASPADAEALNELAQGVTYRAVLTRARDTRSVAQNNLRWKVCSLIAENLPDHLGQWTKEGVNDALKIATGHVDFRQSPDGQFWRFPKPTDFQAVGSADFTAWLDRAFTKAAELFGPALVDAVRDELQAMIDGLLSEAPAAAEASPEPELARDRDGFPIDLSKEPADIVLAWADNFEERLRTCRPFEVAEYWGKAHAQGRLGSLMQVSPDRHAKLKEAMHEAAPKVKA